MKTKADAEVYPLLGIVTIFLAVAWLLPSAGCAGGVVTNCTEAALREAIAAGGTVTFACNGTITLASTITNNLNLRLDASGHSITISGLQAFYVSSNSTLTLVGLTITSCSSPSGVAIINDSGTLNLANVAFVNNYNYDYGYPFPGGAIYNKGGGLSANNCTFDGNAVIMPWNGNHAPGTAAGGALYIGSGTVNLQQCRFAGNSAQGGFGSDYLPDPGDVAYGGAIFNAGNLAADLCTFVGNSAQGGNGGNADMTASAYGWPGGPGGNAYGGALYNVGNLTATRCLFEGNGASAGSGGHGKYGANNTYSYGGSGGPGGAGGSAGGGDVFCVSEGTFVNCTFSGSGATAGSGASGGKGGNSIQEAGGPGGAGGNGGSASGGTISGPATLVNCSVLSGSITYGGGGSGGAGGSGPWGTGAAGAPGTSGSACGAGASGVTLINTLLAGGNNCCGCSDGGHNLSSDGTCQFTGPGSMNNTDPKLGPLANNGGPTLTMALLPGSPAIDAGNTSLAPATDQRGFPRPAGLAADIGAFEYGSVMPSLTVSLSGLTGLNILAGGNSNQPCRLLMSMDLATWVPIATNQFGSGGTVLFYDTRAPGGDCRFYRLVMP